MVPVRRGLATAFVALVALLACLGATLDLAAPGWGAGVAGGLLLTAAVAHGAAREGVRALGPADLVTLTRAALACAVAALVADAFVVQRGPDALVALAAVALLLDAVDGRVARYTRTVSAFGARFDGEADAFLILVLSVYVARSAGPWVLAIGLARYAFAAAGWVLPWLRGQLPVRYWAKAVTAVQGVVLTVAAAGVAPPAATYAALALALALLAESFEWSVRWLWRHRSTDLAPAARPVHRVRVP